MPKFYALILAMAVTAPLGHQLAQADPGVRAGQVSPRTAGTDRLALEDVFTLRLAVSDLQRQVGALKHELDALRYRYAGHRHYLEGDAVAVDELFTHRARYRNYVLLLSPKGHLQTTAPLQ